VVWGVKVDSSLCKTQLLFSLLAVAVGFAAQLDRARLIGIAP